MSLSQGERTPRYPLEGTRFDIRTAAVSAMPPKDSFRFIRDFLNALSAGIKQDRMRLLSRMPFKDEDNEVRNIAVQVKIPHEVFVAARAAVRDKLAVLRRGGGIRPTVAEEGARTSSQET
jgi:hypothetical protein